MFFGGDAALDLGGIFTAWRRELHLENVRGACVYFPFMLAQVERRLTEWCRYHSSMSDTNAAPPTNCRVHPLRLRRNAICHVVAQSPRKLWFLYLQVPHIDIHVMSWLRSQPHSWMDGRVHFEKWLACAACCLKPSCAEWLWKKIHTTTYNCMTLWLDWLTKHICSTMNCLQIFTNIKTLPLLSLYYPYFHHIIVSMATGGGGGGHATQMGYFSVKILTQGLAFHFKTFI